MSEKQDDSFKEEDDDDIAEGDEDVSLDEIIRDLDSTKRRRAPRGAHEPTWRRLERFLEERRTAVLLTDFDDYDIGDRQPVRKKSSGKKRG